MIKKLVMIKKYVAEDQMAEKIKVIEIDVVELLLCDISITLAFA